MVLNTLSDPAVTKLLQEGSVGVIPTDTVYGLACQAANEEAVQRLYRLKNRERKPGTVIAASIDQLVELGIPRRYLKAVEQFWPGPISIIIPSHGLSYIHLGLGGIAMRVSKDQAFNKLLLKVGPLLTTSANQPSKPEATTIGEAQQYFGNKVDFYVDGGNLAGREASTVIRVIDDAIEVVRPGAVKINEAGKIENDV